MNRSFVKQLFLVLAILSVPTISLAQDDPAIQTENTNGLNVFLDCHTWCEMDHFRREIAFVNWVRDRADADVHIIVTTQGSGGGREFVFKFIGLRNFSNRSDTLRYFSSSTNVREETRAGQTQSLKMGLMPFLANTPAADRISITYFPPAQQEVQVEQEDDPWNLWVFRIGGNGSFSAESQRKDYSFGGNVRATRTSEDWYFRFYGRGRFSEDRIDINDDSTAVYRNDTYLLEGTVIRNLGRHWGVGFRAEAEKSVYYNRDFSVEVDGGVEFSPFPYSESTRKALTFLYTIGVAGYNYEEVTIFDQTSEVRLRQTLEISLQSVQPWGQTGAFLEGSTFLHDLDLHRIQFGTHINLRLVRGLSFNISGFTARIKDQIFLSGEGIPQDDRLLRRRALGTDYELGMHFGLSYTFGSIYNNIVNPTMDEFR